MQESKQRTGPLPRGDIYPGGGSDSGDSQISPVQQTSPSHTNEDIINKHGKSPSMIHIVFWNASMTLIYRKWDFIKNTAVGI